MNISTPFAGLSSGSRGMNSNMIQPIAIAARVNFIFSEFRIVFSFVSNSPNLGLVDYGMDVVDSPNQADLSLLMATNSQ